MFSGGVPVNLVRVQEEFVRAELTFVPHSLGHVLLDVAVLSLVQADAEAVGELGVTPHGRHPGLLAAQLTPVLAALAQVIAVHPGTLDVLTVKRFKRSLFREFDLWCFCRPLRRRLQEVTKWNSNI